VPLTAGGGENKRAQRVPQDRQLAMPPRAGSQIHGQGHQDTLSSEQGQGQRVVGVSPPGPRVEWRHRTPARLVPRRCQRVRDGAGRVS